MVLLEKPHMAKKASSLNPKVQFSTHSFILRKLLKYSAPCFSQRGENEERKSRFCYVIIKNSVLRRYIFFFKKFG